MFLLMLSFTGQKTSVLHKVSQHHECSEELEAFELYICGNEFGDDDDMTVMIIAVDDCSC